MPAMPDYPAHLATFLSASGGAKAPLLAHFYRVHWAASSQPCRRGDLPRARYSRRLAGATAIFLSFAVVAWVALGRGSPMGAFPAASAGTVCLACLLCTTQISCGVFSTVASVRRSRCCLCRLDRCRAPAAALADRLLLTRDAGDLFLSRIRRRDIAAAYRLLPALCHRAAMSPAASSGRLSRCRHRCSRCHGFHFLQAAKAMEARSSSILSIRFWIG